MTWDVKQQNKQKQIIPPEASESESDSVSGPDDNIPLARMIKKHRQERETPEDEDDIPLMELRKRLNYSDLRQNKKENIKVKDMEYDDEVSSDNSCILKAIKNATGTSIVFPVYISFIHYVLVLTSVPNVGERFTKT